MSSFWIDLGTPKEVLFFRGIGAELKRRGHEVFFTTRLYRETNDLIEHFGLKATVVGRHGKTRNEKLSVGITRMQELFNLFQDKNISGLITLVNPEACRVAYGFGFPIYNFVDMPEGEIICRLTLPLSHIVFIPFHVSRRLLSKYWTGKTFTYNCLDVAAWMPQQPSGCGREITHPFIMYREAETQASYYANHKDITHEVIAKLKKQLPDAVFYGIPRYGKHEIVDLQSLLYYADLFVGGGGTITEEACWWGTWSLTCRPFKSSYDEWLIRKGLLESAKSVKQGVKKCLQLLKKKEKNPAAIDFRKQRFPLRQICNVLQRRTKKP